MIAPTVSHSSHGLPCPATPVSPGSHLRLILSLMCILPLGVTYRIIFDKANVEVEVTSAAVCGRHRHVLTAKRGFKPSSQLSVVWVWVYGNPVVLYFPLSWPYTVNEIRSPSTHPYLRLYLSALLTDISCPQSSSALSKCMLGLVTLEAMQDPPSQEIDTLFNSKTEDRKSVV